MEIMRTLLILTFVGGSFSYDCHSECDYGLRPTTYPETAEELLRICENFQTFRSCLADVRESCGYDDEDEIKAIRDSNDYLNTMCKEDNPTFKTFSSSLKCMRPVIEKLSRRSCIRSYSEKTSEAIDTYLFSLFGVEEEDEQLAKCLSTQMLESRCIGTTMGYHCGQELRDAFEELSLNMEKNRCPEEAREKAAPIYQAYEAILLKELELENAIDERK